MCYLCKHWSLKLTYTSLIVDFGAINAPATRCILYYLSLLFDFVYLSNITLLSELLIGEPAASLAAFIVRKQVLI